MKTAEYVSLGHPDKISDYITSYILDRFLEQDTAARYAVEVMIKANTVVLGGEICSKVKTAPFSEYVKNALREIGYDERYTKIWGQKAIDINKVEVINLIDRQSCEIAHGVMQDGWGDQGVFIGYACQGEDNLNRELFLARKLNRALYDKARHSNNLGLDIKTQITIDDNNEVATAIVAIPMLKTENLEDFIAQTLGVPTKQIIINGAGNYTIHSSMADCGVTGRKLAVDFYSTASAVGGGSPWAKDATKADVTLNLYARRLAVENLANNDEVWVYLSSCIGQADLPSAVLKCRKDSIVTEKNIKVESRPSVLIEKLGLNKPIYTKLCRNGLV